MSPQRLHPEIPVTKTVYHFPNLPLNPSFLTGMTSEINLCLITDITNLAFLKTFTNISGYHYTMKTTEHFKELREKIIEKYRSGDGDKGISKTLEISRSSV